MVKDKDESTEEAPQETVVQKVELLETIKEKGIGLRMPDGQILDLSDTPLSTATWMAWVTETLDELKKNLVA